MQPGLGFGGIPQSVLWGKDQGQQTSASRPSSDFVKKVLLEHNHPRPFTCCLWVRHTVMADLRNYNRVVWVPKLNMFIIWPLEDKSDGCYY